MEEVIEKAEQNFEDLLVKTGNVPLIEAYADLKSGLYQVLENANKAIEVLEKKVG